jgi:aspartate aminotransferase
MLKETVNVSKWLEPQARFERIRFEALRRFGPKLCDLSYANAYDGPSDQLRQILHDAVDSERSLGFQYTPYGGATLTRRRIAESIRPVHDLPWHWEDVILTPGAMAALNVAFRAVKEQEGDEVIVVSPCWLDYPLYLENLGLKPVFVPVESKSMRIDLKAIEQAMTPTTRAIIFSQPANPSGVLFEERELRALSEMLRSAPSQPTLISDECHRDFVFDPHRFVSPAQFWEKTLVVYSFGKKLFLQGQRIGYLAVSPRHERRIELRQSAVQLCRTMGFCTPTALMQRAIPETLKMELDLQPIERRRQRLIETLPGLGYALRPSDATLFLYPRVPNRDAWFWTEKFASLGLLVLPSDVFHHEGHFRLSLTATDEMIDRALPIFAQALSEVRLGAEAEGRE